MNIHYQNYEQGTIIVKLNDNYINDIKKSDDNNADCNGIKNNDDFYKINPFDFSLNLSPEMRLLINIVQLSGMDLKYSS